MPSRPPLLSELKPSTSGIIQDPHTGDRRVAPSKRPDGSVRKEIKIRPGFTPPEDVSKYKSARQQEFDSRKLSKGSVIGMMRGSQAAAQAALKGMSDAQKKNAKRKEKRKAAQKPDEADVPEDWECSSSGSRAGADAVDPASVSLGDDKKPPVANQTNQDPIPMTPVSSSKVGNGNTILLESALRKLENTNPPDKGEPAEKRAKAIKKKLTQAEQLKVRRQAGETLLPEQLHKISMIQELQLELENLNL